MHIQRIPVLAFLLPALCVLSGCGDGAPPAATEVRESAPAASDAAAVLSAPDAFMAALREHCGRAYAGRIVTNVPAEPNDPFEGKALIMHVRECAADEIRVPFHVGEDHSRTWVISRTDNGLRLKHDHRHEDGSEDSLTQYGGDTTSAGSAQRQEFPVDQFSIDMFEAQDRAVSTTNTWAIEIEPGRRYLYELSRPGGRLLQVEFDLGAPVATPPTPWGYAATEP